MIRHRVQGFLCLHSFTLALLSSGAFIASVVFFRATEVVVLNADANFTLYFFGVVMASMWFHRHLRGTARSYANLSLRDCLRLTGHQLMRLMLVMFAIAFVTKDVGVSRIFLTCFIGFVGVILFSANMFLPRLLGRIFATPTQRRTAIVANAEDALRLRGWLTRYAELGLDTVVGYIAEQPAKGDFPIPYLGAPSQLSELVGKEILDQVFIDQAEFQGPRSRKMVEQCERHGCRVRSFIHISALLPSPTAAFEHDGQYAFATVTPEPLQSPLNRVVKRLCDIAVAVPVVLFVLPPVLLVTAIFQRFQSRGPILYCQLRSGIDRRRFLIFKIRTMHLNDGSRVAQQARRGDDRIYAFGRFLRRTSLDELPQFLNVLRGEMSVSGPRPHLLEHDEAFAQVIGYYRKRHFVKPGITGLAQAKGYRGEVARPEILARRVRYDMHYIAKWSLLLDIKIMFSTIRQIFLPPRSAY
ncbi:MAG: exopolysaccharide biosynthesis polyprenyl glycosylphosphotransferase [Verrucomicrobiota bacterium]